jgi:hypothetical protein
MWYKDAMTVGLALALLGLASTLASAQQSANDILLSTGVIATISAIDAHHARGDLADQRGVCVCAAAEVAMGCGLPGAL